MTPLQVFYFKLIAIVVTTIIVWIGAKSQFLQQQKSGKVILYTWLITRLLLFLAIFIIADESPRGDVPFFWGKATQAYQWKLVYRDFLSFHAPFFAYIIALPLYLWYNMKAIVLLMVLAEGLIIWATYAVYKSIEADILQDVVLYLCLPAPAIMLLLGGQEDIWFWGLAVWLIHTSLKNIAHQDAKLGLQFSTGFLIIKASLIFWFFPLLINIRKKISFLLPLGVVGIATVVILYLNMGTTFLMPIQHTGFGALTPNLWSVLQPIWGEIKDFGTANWIGLGLTITISSAMAYQMRYLSLRHSIPLSFIATFIVMMLCQPSAPGYYAYTFLLPLGIELVSWKNTKDVLVLLAFNAALIIQPFLFTYLNSPAYIDINSFQSPIHILEYTLQWAVIGCLLWYFRKVYIRVQQLSNQIG